MMPENVIPAGVTEEAAAVWWLKTYAGVDGPVVVGGRLNKRGTPIFDTNWTPALALVALKYRAIGWDKARIARAIDKSHHAVRDLFSRVDFWESHV
ncbi:MAG: hypothetical protein HGB26_01480 [Desulfobulbaceae bacterium]|nr:hypothetical protein [Desulfobulbaceae bacterium]